MADHLEAGVTRLLEATGFDADPDQPISDQMLRELAVRVAQLHGAQPAGFDLGGGQGSASGIDWLTGAAERWSSSYSPYEPAKPHDALTNVSEFLVKLAGGKENNKGAAGFDSLGKSLLGSKGSAKGSTRS